MKKFVDLHMHTTFSDGEHNLDKIVEMVEKSDIKYFSITDHDSLSSCILYKRKECLKTKYVTGCEISSVLDNKYNLHILAYNIDYNNKDLINLIDTIRNKREEKFDAAIKYFKNKGFNFTNKEINDFKKTKEVIGKPHIKKFFSTYNLTDEYMKNRKNLTDENGKKLNYKQDSSLVIKTIHKAGGIAVLAHPKEAENKYKIDIDIIIPKLKKLGLDGIETHNSIHNVEDIKKYQQIAKENNFLTSAGSDFHGESVKKGIRLSEVSKENIKVKHVSMIDKLF